MEKQTAQTIMNQIGNKALVMIGAKNFNFGQAGLSMKIASKKANYLTINYDRGEDLYSMHFQKLRGPEFKTVGQYTGIYCDQLCKIIREVTGLATNL